MNLETPPEMLRSDPPSAELRRDLLGWYDAARRELPWRARPGEPADPYAVLVSELMLQQTTVATVMGRFGPFMARFPSLAALAAAPLEAVLHAWQGLGYYRRARALHACAQAVMTRHQGRLPADLASLRALPGIGPYTAAAIAAIAFGRPEVPVDGNIERVLSRVFALETPLPAGRRQLERVAARFAATERAGDFAQAVMELGALVCTPQRPACLACPWRSGCEAARRGAPESFPRRLVRAARPERHAIAFLFEQPDGAVLFRRRPLTGLLGGMIELPSTEWLDNPEATAAAVDAAAPGAAAWAPVPGDVRHVFTHMSLSVRVLRAEAPITLEGLWVRPYRFGELALPTLTKKLLRHAGLRW